MVSSKAARKSKHHKKEDRTRVENAHVRSAVSIAGLASALAAVVASEDYSSSSHNSKLNFALASATQILASYCIEMAEVAGADHERVTSSVKSAVDIHTPGDLMTLTATALRGAAALRSRLPKEAKRNASISPYDKGITQTHWPHAFEGQMWQHHPPRVGDLLQLTRQGVVYGVCDKDGAWPYRKEREASEEFYFGLKTAQGLLEFNCKSKLHKQEWVDGIESLLRRVNSVEVTQRFLEFFSVN